VPTSIRSTDVPVVHGSASDLRSILDIWLAAHADGIACVIGTNDTGHGSFRATSRVRSLTPELSKGLEFDLVILIDPERFGAGIEGAVDRYVAMTRATQQLVILTNTGHLTLMNSLPSSLSASPSGPKAPRKASPTPPPSRPSSESLAETSASSTGY
jgi:hypothetical protein